MKIQTQLKAGESRHLHLRSPAADHRLPNASRGRWEPFPPASSRTVEGNISCFGQGTLGSGRPMELRIENSRVAAGARRLYTPTMGSSPVVLVQGLRKTYGRTVAVDDVSFEVVAGEIFGLIGPNGAGKTTTMECACGLRRPDRGRISVLGRNPHTQAYELQNLIGVQLQQAQLQKRIKVWEAVDLWAALYPRTVDGEELLERLGLASKRNAWFMNLSGGQKQRLFIALALINDPELVFLDELTTGLDPQARHAIWSLVTVSATKARPCS